MTGMTLKQYAKHRFYRLCGEYKALKARGLKTNEDKAAFIALSVQIHAAKADVPKRMWPMVNR